MKGQTDAVLSKSITWVNYPDKDAKEAFRQIADKVIYGENELLDAWYWFSEGFRAGKRHARNISKYSMNAVYRQSFDT